MANGNNFWRKVWTIFSIFVVCVGVVAGYCDTKFKTQKNEKDIVKLETKVERGFDKLEKKMEEFKREQIVLKVQNAQILEMVKYLKERAN